MEGLLSGALDAAQKWLGSTPRSKEAAGRPTSSSSQAGPSTSTPTDMDEESRRAAKEARKAEKKARKAAKEAAALSEPTGSSKKHKRDKQKDTSKDAIATVARATNGETGTEKRKKKRKDPPDGELPAVSRASAPQPAKKKRNDVADGDFASEPQASTSEPAKKKRRPDKGDKDQPASKESRPSSRPVPVPPSQRYSSGSKSSKRAPVHQRQPKMDDETIRARVSTPKGLNGFLSERWIDPAELRRLKNAGIINYKTGPFTETEKSAIRQHFEDFKRVSHLSIMGYGGAEIQLNRLSQDELVDIIFAKGRTSERTNYGRFWPDTAANLPGRPVKYVRDAAMRMYNPDGHKGAWTEAEDQKLRMAYDVHPQQWRKIAAVVERTDTDCRDRWQKQLAGKDDRTSGFWSPEEVESLVDSIKAANEALGQDAMSYEAPWEVVAKMMGGKRSSTSCRKKWQGEIRPLRVADKPKRGFKTKHKRILVDMLKGFGVEHERDITFARLNTGGLAGFSTSQVYQVWLRMKRSVDPHGTLAWPELLKGVDAHVERLVEKRRKKAALLAREVHAKKAKAVQKREKKAEKEKRKVEKQQEIEAKKKAYPSKEFLSSDDDDEDE